MSTMLFLSCSLKPTDEKVNEYFNHLAELHDIKLITINIPGLSEEQVIQLVKEYIPKVEGVIVLWVPRYYINGALPSMWTILESVVGIVKDKPVYVFYEQGVSLEGPLKAIGKVRVEFNRLYFHHQQEYQRLCSWMQWIKNDVEKKKAEDFWRGVVNAIFKGLGLVSLFGFGFLLGMAYSSRKNNQQ